MPTVHAFEFLETPPTAPPDVCVLFGGDALLRRLARGALLRGLQGDADADLSVAAFEGPQTTWRDVFAELSTRSLFGGGRRVAVVEEADEFVTKFRDRLEKYVAKPASSGLLILQADTWLATTKLYKAVDAAGLQIECRPPHKSVGKNKVVDEPRLAKWLVARAKTTHGCALEPAAANELLALVGTELGLLDQDLAKLALFALDGRKITPTMVRDIVGGWRAKSIWELSDSMLDGAAADALAHLDRLLTTGEHPLALLGSIAWSLRRFAHAARVFEQAERQGRKLAVREALSQAGVKDWPAGALDRAERQLKQLGRRRAGRLHRWLLELDLALKGSHSHADRARHALEELALKLAKEAPR